MAIGVVALIALGIALVADLAGRGGLDAIAPRYLPATTIQYLDLRFDLPGDQRQEVAKLLALFPGFEDASTLDLKADDTFERLVKAATDGKASYTSDIKPWFGGQIAEGVTGLPGLGALITGSGSSGLELPVIGLLSVKDASRPSGRRAPGVASGLPGGRGLDGDRWSPDVDLQRRSGDASAGDRDPDRRHARGHGCRRGAKASPRHAGGREPGQLLRVQRRGLPDARLKHLRRRRGAQADRRYADLGFRAQARSPPSSLDGRRLTVRDASIISTARAVRPICAEDPGQRVDPAADVPGASLVYAEATMSGPPSAPAREREDDPASGSASGESIEASSVPSSRTSSPGSGRGRGGLDDRRHAGRTVVAEVIDTAAASGASTAAGFLQLASIGGSVTTATTTYAGTTITNVTVSDADQDVTISFALSDTTFVLGIGEASVKAVLDVTTTTALAADPGYQATMKAAGPSTNSGSAYATCAASGRPGPIPAIGRNRYEQEVEPWLLPSMVGVVTYRTDRPA